MKLVQNIMNVVQSRFWAPKNILALEYEGYGLKAFLVYAKAGRIQIKDSYESNLADPDKALEEVVGKIRSRHKLPKKAVLLSSEAVPALLELPVDSRQPRPRDQMHELVRWEMEPYLAEQITTKPIGGILIGRSYLTYAQAKEIINAMETQKDTLHQNGPLLRFGEVALKKGYIDHGQLEECLSIQERFQFIEDDPVVGWSYQKDIGFSGDSRRSSWFACGMSRSVRDHWKTRLIKFGVQLKGIYPLVSSSTASLNGLSDDHCIVLEMYKGLIGCTRLLKGQMESLRLYYLSDEEPSLGICQDLIGDRVNKVFFAGGDKNLKKIYKEMKDHIHSENQLFTFSKKIDVPDSVPQESVANLIGAVSHITGLPDGKRIASVSAEDPGPPLKNRNEFWLFVAMAIIVFVMELVETSLQMNLKGFKKEAIHVMNKLEPLEDANEKILRQIKTNNELQSSLDEKMQVLNRGIEKIKLMEVLLEERQSFVPFLMRAVAGAVNDDVVMERIIETNKQTFQITGWALTEKSAQQFVRSLSRDMVESNMNTEDLSVWVQAGRTGMNGYAFSLNLVEISEDKL